MAERGGLLGGGNEYGRSARSPSLPFRNTKEPKALRPLPALRPAKGSESLPRSPRCVERGAAWRKK